MHLSQALTGWKQEINLLSSSVYLRGSSSQYIAISLRLVYRFRALYSSLQGQQIACPHPGQSGSLFYRPQKDGTLCQPSNMQIYNAHRCCHLTPNHLFGFRGKGMANPSLGEVLKVFGRHVTIWYLILSQTGLNIGFMSLSPISDAQDALKQPIYLTSIHQLLKWNYL